MEYFTPQPNFHTKLNLSSSDKLISNVSSNGKISTLCIPPPSPPQSPLARAILTHEDHNSLLVSNSWNSEFSNKSYRRSTHTFLSQYHIFKNNLINNNTSTTTTDYQFRVRKNKDSNSDTNSIVRPSKYHYRTRRVTKQHTINSDDSDNTADDIKHSNDEDSFSSRKPLHVRKINNVSPTVSTLASKDIISKIPQYIPEKSWKLIPDYSPSIDTLPKNNINCMKIDWKGSSMDLTNDPLKYKLHPAELIVAQLLRLPCDLYLDSKRRLFLEKTYRMKKGLPFRRTDAQKACKIDVNKASRLYTAFDKVDWLNDEHFIKYL